ncbi:hypothetical protein ACFXPN_36925 [Streptomyces griseorubiginosus]|uniref:hypothetical protein n=1 Tax=Streptomyces griseorubiginosus TaxID=67304 RepID=UPI00368C7280
MAGGTPILVHNVDLCDLNAGETSSTTHWAHATIHDATGAIVHEFDIRSGNQTPSEKSMGRGGETLSHTENRIARMIGGVPMYGQKVVGDDEFFSDTPVPEGGYVVIRGTRPPCSSCRGAMTRGAEDTGAVIAYYWESAPDVVEGWWQTDLPLSWRK